MSLARIFHFAMKNTLVRAVAQIGCLFASQGLSFADCTKGSMQNFAPERMGAKWFFHRFTQIDGKTRLDLPADSDLRILVTRTDRLGDLVLSTPVFEALRNKFPKAFISVLVFQENREVVEGNPHINEVILYDKKGREKGLWGQTRLAFKLGVRQFDLVIHLHATNRMHLLTLAAGIPRRLGWQRKCAWALTHSFPDIKKEGLKHEAFYNFDLLEPLEIYAQTAKVRAHFPLNEKNRRSLNELLVRMGISIEKPWVVFNPSASCPSKIWPAERFAELADKIQAHYSVECLAIGARADRIHVERMIEAAKTPMHDLSGRLSLGTLGELLSRSGLLISNDSGPVHLANAVGLPVISIFGRKQPGLSPLRWGPLDAGSRVVWKDVSCETCSAHLCPIHFLCLDVISVDEVFGHVNFFENRLLSKGART